MLTWSWSSWENIIALVFGMLISIVSLADIMYSFDQGLYIILKVCNGSDVNGKTEVFQFIAININA